MSTRTIAEQVDEFNVGFNEQIGDRLAAVFDSEQKDLIAGGVPASAVTVGDTVDDASLVAADGSLVSLAEAIAGTPAVIVFYRGAWCPYCNIALRTYQTELAPELAELGVALIAVSPQSPDGTAAAKSNGSLEFTVLSDPSAKLITSLGILTEPSPAARSAHTDLGFDVADSNADATARIPFPTVLVVDAGRVVHFADVRVDYTTRTEPGDILDAVNELIRRDAA